jgi:monoamine oxidase
MSGQRVFVVSEDPGVRASLERLLDEADLRVSLLESGEAFMHQYDQTWRGISWERHPWTLGHMAYRAPGQIRAFGTVLAEPHGRIHFAGEHTALLTSGMEGAMESGERAALEILQRR